MGKPKNKRPNERKSREEGEITLSSTEHESRESRQDLLDYFDSSSASEDSSDDDNNEDRNPDSKLKPKLSTKHQRKLQNQEALFQKFAHILKQAKEKSVKYKDYQGEDYFQTCHMIVPEASIGGFLRWPRWPRWLVKNVRWLDFLTKFIEIFYFSHEFWSFLPN